MSDLTLLGIPTTQAFLRDALRHPLFADGKATTRFIETAFPDGWKPNADELLRLRAAACVVWAQLDVTRSRIRLDQPVESPQRRPRHLGRAARQGVAA